MPSGTVMGRTSPEVRPTTLISERLSPSITISSLTINPFTLHLEESVYLRIACVFQRLANGLRWLEVVIRAFDVACEGRALHTEVAAESMHGPRHATRELPHRGFAVLPELVKVRPLHAAPRLLPVELAPLLVG